MNRQTEEQSAAVPEAKQAEEARLQRWGWVKRTVWTDRMLAALEDGVKGGKWFSLMDKVYRKENLWTAWMDVTANQGSAGNDGQTILQFNQRVTEGINRLHDELREGRYTPQPALRHWIPKPGSKEKRPLGIPAVRDRIVQGSLKNVIEPIFEKIFAEHSYGFRPGRGCKGALRRVDQLLRSGKTWIVDVDFKSYFDTIPHDRLMEMVKEQIADGKVLTLIEKYLKAGVMERLKGWEPTEQGTPQGAVVSPLLANLYLNPLDHLMQDHGYAMTRYADDSVVQCESQEEAEAALRRIRQWATDHGLTIHPEKTRIVDATQRGGFDFLGYHFERGMKWPREKSMAKLKETIRARTKRSCGRSINMVIAQINPTLIGWRAYFHESIKNVLEDLDGWIRGRLRSILKKQQKRKGRAKGQDHQRWPNAYFEARGLFSLTNGRRASVQSR